MKVTVCGLGLVGRGITSAAASAGKSVIAIDLNESVLSEISDLIESSKYDKHLPDWEIYRSFRVNSNNITFLNSYQPDLVSNTDVWVICVDTPSVPKCAEMIGPHLDGGELVIVESTISPTEYRHVVRILQRKSGLRNGRDFDVVVAPERIMEDRTLHNLYTLPRSIGAKSEEAFIRARDFYRSIGCRGNIYICTPEEASMTKVVENSYRGFKIAYANLVYDVCTRFSDVDFYSVKSIINEFGIDLMEPSVGAGGHCLPLAMHIISSIHTDKTTRCTIPNAIVKYNDSRPERFVEAIANAILSFDRDPDIKIAILGVAYRPNGFSIRSSFAMRVAMGLADRFRNVFVYDPNINSVDYIDNGDVNAFLEGKDVVVILVPHDDFYDVLLTVENVPKAVIDPFNTQFRLPDGCVSLRIKI